MRRIVYALLGFLFGFAFVHLAAAGEHILAISSDGIPTRGVRLMEERSPAPTARGTIILTTGQYGTAEYRGVWKDQTKADLRAMGFDVWGVQYTDREGWATGAAGKGYRGGMAIFEDVVSYILANARSPVLGAQGNSGGAFQILYAMEAGTEFSVAIASGVPFASHRSVPDPLQVFCWGDDRTGYLLGWPNGTCRGSGNYSLSQVQQMDADAVLSGAGAIRNVYLMASQDNARDMTAVKRLYPAASKPKRKRLCPGAEHEVDDTQCGHEKIVAIFDNRMPD